MEKLNTEQYEQLVAALEYVGFEHAEAEFEASTMDYDLAIETIESFEGAM